ncbi:hypothetical protein Ancab_021969 [Ancistrocladus abbreviatus]
MRWERKINGSAGSSSVASSSYSSSSSSSASSNSLIIRLQRRAATTWECCQGSCLLKQLARRIRLRWTRRLLKHQRPTTGVHYNYGLRNYCQNFDDGSSIHKRC